MNLKLINSAFGIDKVFLSKKAFGIRSGYTKNFDKIKEE